VEATKKDSLLFSFLKAELVAGINDMNQWKDRTTSME
jgi:hypothetical protein